MTKEKSKNFLNIKKGRNKFDRSIILRSRIYKLIPIFLSLFLITIFFWPSIYSNNTKKIQNIKTEGGDKENFTFQGIDDLEQPFYLHAQKYQKIINSENKLLFEKPKAEINLKKGKWLTIVAKRGIFDIEKQTLELVNDVLVLHSDGEQIDTNNAIIDLKKSKFYGNEKIFGKGRTINFSSDGFEVEKTGKKIFLFGKSKIKINKF